MRRTDFSYDLPDTLIAQYPPPERGESRLLYLDGATGETRDGAFGDLPDLLESGDLLVLNDTRVIPARLLGRKATGGAVEVLVERVLEEGRCLAHVRASKAPRAGARLFLGDGAEICVLGREDGLFLLRMEGHQTWWELMDAHGRIPLPPYIQRSDEADDRGRYQTVYAREAGAVAAPTAGLHFDDGMLEALACAGVRLAYLTLHVGAGTFQTVRAKRVQEHTMHREYLRVTQGLVDEVQAARERGGRVIAVGTTSVRALESAAVSGRLAPFEGDTDIFIYPGYRFRVVDAMLTNFHLPESTLLMLVSAFAGRERVLAAYRHAVAQGYRFFSYGDAMFVTRAPEAGAM